LPRPDATASACMVRSPSTLTPRCTRQAPARARSAFRSVCSTASCAPCWTATAAPADHAAVCAERSLLAALHGGCSVPVGAYAARTDGGLRLCGQVTGLDGTRHVAAAATGADAGHLGTAVAGMLLDQGAEDLFKEIRHPISR
jgi:porphobilinogen deaminase